jgi:hypothetical protein
MEERGSMSSKAYRRSAADEARAAWHLLRDALAESRDAHGFDDPRTIALEEQEAEACEAYLLLNA